MDVFVRKLRQKLERVSPDWLYVHTHFGVGYRFAAEKSKATDAVDQPSAPAGAGAGADRGRRAGGSSGIDPLDVTPGAAPAERVARLAEDLVRLP